MVAPYSVPKEIGAYVHFTYGTQVLERSKCLREERESRERESRERESREREQRKRELC